MRLPADAAMVTTQRMSAGAETEWVRIGETTSFRRLVAGDGGEVFVVEGELRPVGDDVRIVEVGRRPARAGVRIGDL